MWLDDVTQGVFLGCALLICLFYRDFDMTDVELLV